MTQRLGTTVRSQTPALDLDGDDTWHLVVVHTPQAALLQRAFPLTARTTRLGRDPEPGAHARIVLPDDRASRLHATITSDERGAEIADCGSTNGLFVDGRRVATASLDAGSVIRVGETLLVVVEGTPGSAEDERGLGLLGRSPGVASLRALVRRVGPSALPVAIMGDTGTGKEVVARALHAESKRAGAFVPVNCAALPAALVESILFGHRKGAYTGATADEDGAFVRADGGTLFLDEIGELSREAQAKLLRVLEDGEVLPVGASRPVRVDARLVTATNVPLERAVAEGRFRDDLYARVVGLRLSTPPLDERREDLLLLFHHFASPLVGARAATADFAEALLLHPWTRNVREVQKLTERLCVLHPAAERWEVGMLEDDFSRRVLVRGRETGDTAPVKIAGPPSREELVELLARFQGNVTEVARYVGRNRKQVYRWMDQHGLPRNTGRD